MFTSQSITFGTRHGSSVTVNAYFQFFTISNPHPHPIRIQNKQHNHDAFSKHIFLFSLLFYSGDVAEVLQSEGAPQLSSQLAI